MHKMFFVPPEKFGFTQNNETLTEDLMRDFKKGHAPCFLLIRIGFRTKGVCSIPPYPTMIHDEYRGMLGVCLLFANCCF